MAENQQIDYQTASTVSDTQVVVSPEDTDKPKYVVEGVGPVTEKQLIEEMNKVVQNQEETAPPKPMLRMKHISHLDLDGYGSTILSEILQSFYPENAMTLETRNILPNKLLQEMEDTLSHSEDYDVIIITDLAVNQNVIDLIRNHKDGNKVHVFDHHICDVHDVPEHISVTEDSPIHKGKLTCATELYYNFIRNDKIWGLIRQPFIREAIAYFVECVRVYDTFEFWSSRNDPSTEIDMSYYDAPRLNMLFHILDRDEFRSYIFTYIYSGTWERLTVSTDSFPWVSKILELEQNKNAKYVEAAIRRITRFPFKYTVYRNGAIHDLDYSIGVIFAEKSSPVIANTALERIEDIDVCAVVSNNQISLYTNRDNVDVCRIAKIFGGGGHKEASGFTIPYTSAALFNMNHFSAMIECAAQLTPGQIVFEDNDVSDTN